MATLERVRPSSSVCRLHYPISSQIRGAQRRSTERAWPGLADQEYRVARTLIIEDEENVRFSIRRTLVKSGHEVKEASCLKDARELLRHNEFDLVLTDVMLGSENGIDLV